LLQSGNLCAFTDCTQQLFDEEEGIFLGEIVHIRAASPGGARYDPSMTPDERRSPSNLVIMCPNHHAIVDRNPAKHTVAALETMKRKREEGTSRRALPPKAVEVALKEVTVGMHTEVKVKAVQGGGAGRRLSTESSASLVKLAQRYPGAGVEVSMILGDAEAAQLVSDIRQAAKNGGWGWIARNQAVYDRNPRGIVICARGDSPLLRDTAQWATESGFKPVGSFKTKAKDLEIIVGRRLQPGEESGWDT